MIQKGDLVVVVGAHCGKSLSWLGNIFTVESIGSTHASRCSGCGQPFPPPTFYACRSDGGCYLLAWLRRIPPLNELEVTKEEITA